MKTFGRNAGLVVMSIVVAIFFQASAAFTQLAPALPQALKQRSVRSKPAKTILNSRLRSDVIVLKFREGTRVRERLGQLEADLTNISANEEQLLQRANLPRQRIFQDLAQINTLIGPNSKHYVKRLFTRSEQELDAEKRDGESRIAEELADLNLYFYILITDAKARETEQFIDQLNALDIVELAYAQPIAEPAVADAASTSTDFTIRQGYVDAAQSSRTFLKNGVDALYARLFPGGRGDGIRIIDIEQGWNLTHEDLPPVFFQAGPNLGDSKHRNHGTAVLGELVAIENSYGITGIAPRSTIGVSSAIDRTCIVPGLCWVTDDLDNSVNTSSAQLGFGDILIIEQHAKGPSSGSTAPSCNPDQFEYVPMEYWDAHFDAIKQATSRGIIVVEAAGNGSMNLDSTIYNGKFDRSQRDSGAILVGAGSSDGRSPLCFTNFGSRVDLQGWGHNVMTLGYGGESFDQPDPALRFNGLDDNRWYTRTFSGTSSATPIVAGAAADLQGFRKARGLAAFSPYKMRDFLVQTGTAQASDSKHIGPLPNLRKAIDAHAPKRTLKVTFLNVKIVDNVFAGAQDLAFTFWVNDGAARYPSTGTVSFPQSVPVALPASLNITTQEILDGGLTVFVSTNLQSVVSFNPKTHQVNSIWDRPLNVLHFFPTGTDFTSGNIASIRVGGGSRTFTDRSADLSGYFEIAYRVEEVPNLVFAQ